MASATRLALGKKLLQRAAMKFLRSLVAAVMVLGFAAAAVRAEEALKALSVKTATKLEIMRAGKTSGSVGLAAGSVLEVIEVEQEWAQVKFRGVEGRVLLDKTDYAERIAELTAKAEAADAAAVAAEIKAQTKSPVKNTGTLKVKPAADRSKLSEMERLLAGKLMRLNGSSFQPVRAPELEGVKFYGVYFSASWCGPCREFTPGFVDAYRKIREIYPEFEVVFVSSDRSLADMTAYMRADKMAWTAVRYEVIKGFGEINRYAGNGIPCLVLVDATGKVLSDSFRQGNYVGPNAVLEDTWKILKEYRGKNPRAKS